MKVCDAWSFFNWDRLKNPVACRLAIARSTALIAAPCGVRDVRGSVSHGYLRSQEIPGAIWVEEAAV